MRTSSSADRGFDPVPPSERSGGEVAEGAVRLESDEGVGDDPMEFLSEDSTEEQRKEAAGILQHTAKT